MRATPMGPCLCTFRCGTTFIIAGMLMLSGCSSDDDSQNKTSCQSAADCQGSVCVARGSTSFCELSCTAGGNECSASASCNGVGAVGINFCDDEPAPTAATPPKAEEQPRIPCKIDAECSQLHAGAICAEFNGVRDCTIPCTTEAQCTLLAVAGIEVDFLACQKDQGNPSRQACLPDPACAQDPMSCVSISLPGGFDMDNVTPDFGVMPDFGF
ncbi:MAG: hypothetical protein JRH20_22435 [Deltaproteobacteria bacterium]|nr:hypothetical protein [Deltaproteobacteria bacterium]